MVPEVGLHPVVIEEGKAGTTTFSCEAVDAPVRCYTPLQLDKAYGWDSFDNRGAGETVVIIDAFQSPTLRQDLKLEDMTFGLPAPKLTILAPEGLTAFNPKNPNMVGWSAEISLDVESVHGYVPDAKIVLVLAKTDSDWNIFRAQSYAINNDLGDVISQSFGGAERCESTSLLDPGTPAPPRRSARVSVSCWRSPGRQVIRTSRVWGEPMCSSPPAAPGSARQPGTTATARVVAVSAACTRRRATSSRSGPRSVPCRTSPTTQA
jgi:hypothetical protein